MTELDLERLRPLVEIMSAERTGDCPELFEDAVQEGLIAAWRASLSHPGRKPAYYQVAARRGVLAVVRGRPLTGEAGRRGWRDAHESAGPLHASDGALAHEPEDPTARAALESVESRDTAIRSAVMALPEADDVHAVMRKFWHGWTWGEVAEAQDVSKASVEWRWREHTRPTLRESLAGYADAY